MEEKKHHGWIAAVVILIAIVFIFLWVLPSITGSDHSTPQLLSRDAKDSDITVEIKNDISFSYNFEITPHIDIENLQITANFYDTDMKLLSTIAKSVGNVTEDTVYTVSISLNEIGVLTALSIRYTRTSVSGGSVSYFA